MACSESVPSSVLELETKLRSGDNCVQSFEDELDVSSSADEVETVVSEGLAELMSTSSVTSLCPALVENFNQEVDIELGEVADINQLSLKALLRKTAEKRYDAEIQLVHIYPSETTGDEDPNQLTYDMEADGSDETVKAVLWIPSNPT